MPCRKRRPSRVHVPYALIAQGVTHRIKESGTRRCGVDVNTDLWSVHYIVTGGYSGWRRRPGRLRVRDVAMGTTSAKKDGDHPILAAGSSGRSSFSIKPTYQGMRPFVSDRRAGGSARRGLSCIPGRTRRAVRCGPGQATEGATHRRAGVRTAARPTAERQVTLRGAGTDLWRSEGG
jgi:hypothetical protein